MKALNSISLFIFLGTLWLVTATHSHFSQDSWSYFELSRHIFDDFYLINTWRQFHVVSNYGISFPPLFPTLIASFNALHDIGIYAGFVMNFIIAAATFKLLRRMSKIWFSEKEFGSLLFFFLMITPDYTTAIFSAGTLPLALFFTLIILYLHHKQHSFLLGLVAGLAVMNRFDFLLPALVLIFFARNRMAYLLALCLTISPWVFYSLKNFGTLWISDNSRTVLSSIPIFVRDYYPDGVPLIGDAPLPWLKKTIGAVIESSDVMFTATTALPFILSIILLAIRTRRIPQNIIVFAAIVFTQLALILPTGFVETRYYVPLQFFLMVFVAALALPLPQFMPRVKGLVQGTFFVLSILFCTAYIAKSYAEESPIAVQFNPTNQTPIEFEKLLKCAGKGTILLLPPKNYSYKFGALTGIKTYIEPTNMNAKNAGQFIEQFKPTHILTSTPKIYGLKSKPICSFPSWGEVQSTFNLYKP